ncbi:MAG: single-stranded-DNA-specific exonuclease RecJ [Chloroflexi bacterium]|nr:single-stranded-DNA-specific exonuclease RecJ [Chloroflexota bacterium]MDA1239643.1 single-stranded-DNA-specific exonuclease RecJ [Chloroflexota bacterium]MQC25607.1 single-stranded-DNA-specific exonuclease RecJ [Chloroflexota bacterium]MQC47700.1 single-stranded-DNA-specific exonuclease RecJ [Chloroflexota bacterium]
MTSSIDTTTERILRGSGGRRWRLLGTPSLDGYADAGDGLPQIVRVLLAHRGVLTTEAARKYLGRPGDLTDARLMPNLETAVTRLARACEAGETVAIFGDYDVDGVTATAVLVEGLTALGAKAIPYLPDRFTEGYGPNVRAVRQLADRGATLLVTADTGTSAVTEVAEANGLGMDVVIIDHHTIPDVLPEALAIVNPRLDGLSYGSEPAAVGVAYKVIHDLHDRLGRGYDPTEHRALVALGNVCDLAPMLAENRDLVRLGLEALRVARRPGLLALFDAAGVRQAEINETTIGWVIGPRINAAGRMEHAKIALDLLLARTSDEARGLAAHLEELNRTRRDATVDALEASHNALTEDDRRGPLIIVASEDISSGIVGLCAGRLAEEFSRPAIVMEVRDGELRASCRSIESFDVTALLQRNADLFLRYGGHRAAAGFSADATRLPELRDRLIADAAQHIDVESLAPTIPVECEHPLEAIDGRFVQWLGLIGPHGVGNPLPLFLARDVLVTETRAVGADGSHLQFSVRAGTVTWRAISFGNAEHAVAPGERADIVYTVKRDDFRGNGSLQLEVTDLRPATAD